jgi:hypothetical protein
MVNKKSKKKIPISEGRWKDIRIRNETAKDLLVIKAKLEFSTYDDVIGHLLDFYTTRKWSA